MAASVKRLEAVGKIVEGLRASYPDAKKLSIDIDFEWRDVDYQDAELCPVVKIEVER
jgi:hypothetical protein